MNSAALSSVVFLTCAPVLGAGITLQPQATSQVGHVVAIDLEDTADEICIAIDGIREPAGTHGSGDGRYWLFEKTNAPQRFDRSFFEGNKGSKKLTLFEQDGFADSDEELGSITINFANGKWDSYGPADKVTEKSNTTKSISGMTLRTLVLVFDKDDNAQYEVSLEIFEGRLGANVCVHLDWSDGVSAITNDEDDPYPLIATPPDRFDEIWIDSSRQILEPGKVSPVISQPPKPDYDDKYVAQVGTKEWKSKAKKMRVKKPELGGGVLFPNRSITVFAYVKEEDSNLYRVPDIDPVTKKQTTDSQGNPKWTLRRNPDDLVGNFDVELSLKKDAAGDWHVHHTWTARDATTLNRPTSLVDESATVQMEATGQGARYWLRGGINVLTGDEPCVD